MILTGMKAIEAAERDPSLALAKYADPVDGARLVTASEAREIAREDPGLIYLAAGEPATPPPRKVTPPEAPRNSAPAVEYTKDDEDLVRRLSEAANDEGTIQAGDMLEFTHEPTLHTTMSVRAAFSAITKKPFDPDYFWP